LNPAFSDDMLLSLLSTSAKGSGPNICSDRWVRRSY